ncbi:hypothetical protein ASC97_31465 [Rhizobium sp. Root1203]|uniref:3-keto-5-aminohexanoate cleavage protein n=1 Tax=Rhizobium sp. Root1203 TaxID=1736427 RepID=UPI00070966A7|nr:3-keto-5-aminohexanoate cleavage protein [Rhizobium sp. Root1203]KQV15012.1 hypothetical protein ASC97_31465 [Rhizobium sp. Root1203]
MGRKVVITCALNGGHDPRVNPAIPITPSEIAKAAVDAAKAGAAMVHLHVRDPSTGLGSMEPALYRETVMRIRDSGCDAILNLTAGAGALFFPSETDPRSATSKSTLVGTEKRICHVEELRPDMASLPMGTVNRGGPIYLNSEKFIEDSLVRFRAAGVKPELDVMDAGQIVYASGLIEKGLIDSPPVFQFCLGWPSSAPAVPESLIYLKGLLPKNATWQAFGRDLGSFPVAAMSILFGGNVRVGLEDSPWLSEGVLASSNTVLIERILELMATLDAEPATSREAREMLGLPRNAP